MTKKLNLNLSSNETIRVLAKVSKDYEPIINGIQEFLMMINPKTKVTNDVIIEKALDALSLHPEIKKFLDDKEKTTLENEDSSESSKTFSAKSEPVKKSA
jgi:hypothetical protein